MELKRGQGFYEVVAKSGETAFLWHKWGSQLVLHETKVEMFRAQLEEAKIEFYRFVRNVQGKKDAAMRMARLEREIIEEENIPFSYGSDAVF